MDNSKKELNILTQMVARSRASEISLYIYTVAVMDMEKKHEEYGKKAYELRTKNNNDLIVFCENSLASFLEIKDFCGISVQKSENRPIDLNNLRERQLLERLLKREIFFFADRDKYDPVGNDCIHLKRAIFQDSSVVIYKKIIVDCTVTQDGRIIVGMGLSHDFERAVTLDKDLAAGLVKEGDEVKDTFHGIAYTYKAVADFTISDNNDYMGTSIIKYYKAKNQELITRGLDPKLHPVLVSTKKHRSASQEIFPYLPNRLRKVARIDSLPRRAKNIFKMTPNDKMKEIVENLVKLSYSAPHLRSGDNKTEHEGAVKWSMVCKMQGLKVVDFPVPKLLFADGYTCNAGYGAISNAIKSVGPYKKSKEKVEIRYFIDHTILEGAEGAGNEVRLKALADTLESKARDNGVDLERVEINDKAFFSVNMDVETQFTLFLRQEMDKGVFKSPTIFMLSDAHLEKNYAAIKKTLGGTGGITTQCVNFDKVAKTEGSARDAYLTNILLGIYAKSGIQSWALSTPLNSDCFIGLDVSREKGVDKGAFIQVVGRDGSIVSTKVVAANQAGEAISSAALKEIFIAAVSSFEAAYGERPRHITIHRDGKCFEDLGALDVVAKECQVTFDYVEVTKEFNRRMATFEGERESGTWRTVFGRAYLGERVAYLTTTDPKNNIGMALPVKALQLTATLPIDKIASDIWALSFMHVHSLLKTRLPVTTYYADLCSTFGVRDWTPEETHDVLFFV